MSDTQNSLDGTVDLEHRNALLEEKNRELVARIKVLSEENRSYEALTRALLENTPFGIVMFDASQRLIQLNKAAETILDLQRVTAIGISCGRIFDCLAAHNNQCPIPSQIKALDRVETGGCGQGCTDKHLLRSVVEIPSNQEMILVEAFIDISEIKQAQAEIENISKIKDSLLSKISHELRTPLNSILGFAELLRENSKEDRDSDEHLFLESIYRSGKELLRMVDEILDITRITANRMKLDEYEVELPSILHNVITRVLAEYPENDNKLTMECDDVPKMVVDPYRLHQLLYHLVHNACKYTHDGEISVRVRRDGQNVLFIVSDTGMGMSHEQVERIFQEFEQADMGNTRQHNGAGLGLSLCHQLSHLMGGELRVNSKLDKGTDFTLSLPDRQQKKMAG